MIMVITDGALQVSPSLTWSYYKKILTLCIIIISIRQIPHLHVASTIYL